MSRNARIRRKLERQRRRNAIRKADPSNRPAAEPPTPQAARPRDPQATQPSAPPGPAIPKDRAASFAPLRDPSSPPNAANPQPPAPPANHQITNLSAVAESPACPPGRNHQIPPRAPLRPETVSRQWSILDRLPPEMIACLEDHVVQARPRQYKLIYETLSLADFGVTYSAFYRYARRLRSNAALHEAAEFKPESAHAAERELPRLYATRLVEALTLDHPSPLHLKRLAEGYRLVSSVESDFWRNFLPRGRRPSAPYDAAGASSPSLESIMQAFGTLLEDRQPTKDPTMPHASDPPPSSNDD